MRTVLTLIAVACAAVIPFQAIINGRLGQLLANPLLAALVSSTSGTVALAIIIVATTPGLPRLPKGLEWSDVPPYLYIGGLLGAVFVTAVLMLVPRLGAANVLAAGVVGQLLTSVIIDHWAILGVPQQPINAAKLAGCGLLVAGLYLIQRH